MRCVVQRVSEASVSVNAERVGEIGLGLLVLLGVGRGDSAADAPLPADKILNLRIFPDEGGHMNLSALDIQAQILVVSQFTLYGDCRTGRRPSYADAAPPIEAQPLYQEFVARLRGSGLFVQEGLFGSTMSVRLINEGPVTLLIDSRR